MRSESTRYRVSLAIARCGFDLVQTWLYSKLDISKRYTQVIGEFTGDPPHRQRQSLAGKDVRGMAKRSNGMGGSSANLLDLPARTKNDAASWQYSGGVETIARPGKQMGATCVMAERRLTADRGRSRFDDNRHRKRRSSTWRRTEKTLNHHGGGERVDEAEQHFPLQSEDMRTEDGMVTAHEGGQEPASGCRTHDHTKSRFSFLQPRKQILI